MTIKTIVTRWLKKNKYDGLCLLEHECGCGLDDFMPCEPYWNCDCVPAYKRDRETCNRACEEHIDYDDCMGECYGPNKPEGKDNKPFGHDERGNYITND